VAFVAIPTPAQRARIFTAATTPSAPSSVPAATIETAAIAIGTTTGSFTRFLLLGLLTPLFLYEQKLPFHDRDFNAIILRHLEPAGGLLN
jgi:hypothetical protein